MHFMFEDPWRSQPLKTLPWPRFDLADRLKGHFETWIKGIRIFFRWQRMPNANISQGWSWWPPHCLRAWADPAVQQEHVHLRHLRDRPAAWCWCDTTERLAAYDGEFKNHQMDKDKYKRSQKWQREGRICLQWWRDKENQELCLQSFLWAKVNQFIWLRTSIISSVSLCPGMVKKSKFL